VPVRRKTRALAPADRTPPRSNVSAGFDFCHLAAHFADTAALAPFTRAIRARVDGVNSVPMRLFRRADPAKRERAMSPPATPSLHEIRLPVVALVASAGGLQALSEVLGALPASLNAAVVVLQHLQPGRQSLLAHILAQRTSLPVRDAEDGTVLRPGTVYVAPASRHLRIGAEGTLSLTDTPPVHFSRPSADVLLESLADAGVPMIAVVLTGRGRDGAAGSLRVRLGGGTVLAQDRATSRHFGMPGAAADAGGVDEALPLARIAPRLVQLVDTLHAYLE
jgi:two-component system chemotaxis response regulator CheB